MVLLTPTHTAFCLPGDAFVTGNLRLSWDTCLYFWGNRASHQLDGLLGSLNLFLAA